MNYGKIRKLELKILKERTNELSHTEITNFPLSEEISKNEPFAMVFGKNCKDTSPEVIDLDFEGLRETMSIASPRGNLSLRQYLDLDKNDKSQKEARAAEKDGPYFIPVRFGKKNTRRADDVIAISCFVIDIDTGKVTREEIKKYLHGYKYFVYSSFSHTPEIPRWRVVIPYKNEILPQEHVAVYEHFQGIFTGNIDLRCKTVNQLWYLPACPCDALNIFESFVGEGEYFNNKLLNNNMTDTTKGKNGLSRMPSISQINTDMQKVKLALDSLSSDEYSQWINFGLALFNSFGVPGFSIWDNWSKQSKKYDREVVETTWNGFRNNSNKKILIGSILHAANLAESNCADVSDILILNEEFFVAPEGSDTFVYRMGIDNNGYPTIVPIKVTAFRNLYKHLRKETHSVADLWLKHPERSTYKGIVFNPSGAENPDYFNTWHGFPFKGVQGSWAKLQQHLLDNICDGDTASFEYLLSWMAFAIQHPDVPAGVAVVLKGDRGTGKGTLISTFMKLFGPHAIQISNTTHLVGNFNAHLQNRIFLFVDEAFFAGDKNGEGVLKTLVTEKSFVVERKGIDAGISQNYLHIMMASNNEWVVPAGNHERRFCILNVNKNKMQDSNYFSAINKEMGKVGLESMMFDLLNRNISNFDIFKIPKNKAFDEQIIRSLPRDLQWFHDRLDMEYSKEEWRYQSREFLQKSYSDFVSTSHDKGSAVKLGMFLAKILPYGSPKRTGGKNANSSYDEVYEFPFQKECRDHFCKHIGVSSLWDDETLEDGCPITVNQTNAAFDACCVM